MRRCCAQLLRNDWTTTELRTWHKNGSIPKDLERLDANINIFASVGVVAECGSFGDVLYVNEKDFEHAARVLDAS